MKIIIFKCVEFKGISQNDSKHETRRQINNLKKNLKYILFCFILKSSKAKNFRCSEIKIINRINGSVCDSNSNGK